MIRVPMLDLGGEYMYMKQDIDSALHNCLAHQQWIFGPEIAAFERAVAGYLNVNDCIAVSSGTEALVLSLRACAIQRKGEEYFNRDDEIITTPFTFTATGDAIIRSGATPVFVDIDPVTYNIDAGAIREYLHSSRGSTRVAGIIPVHLYGRASDMDEVTGIAEEHGAFVVEDVAQAFGAKWKTRKLGSIGSTGAFSFFPSKNLGGFGDAGMVATSDAGTAELVRMLIKHGGRDKYNVDHIGYNGRMDTLQAAILLAKFKYIDEFNARRARIAALYTQELSDVNGLHLPLSSGDPCFAPVSATRHVFHQYTVRTKERDALQAYLKREGVSSMVYYPTPLHKMKVFEGRMKQFGSLTNSEKAAKEVLSLPIGPLQREEDSAFVVECIRKFFGG
jgi:UDP-2-acetamido-2-deoxy-ribo-hexuluronate aminotransferase